MPLKTIIVTFTKSTSIIIMFLNQSFSRKQQTSGVLVY